MYIIKESKKVVKIIHLMSSDAQYAGGTGEIYYTGGITPEDKEIFFDTDKKNRYVPNEIAKKLTIKPNSSGGSFSLVFDFDKVKQVETYLKKYYDVKYEISDGEEFIRSQLEILHKKLASKGIDVVNKAKKQLFASNNISDEDIINFNL